MRATSLKRPDNRKSGFTLLEVMIAVAILGAALVTILSLNSRSILLGSESASILLATMLAQEKLGEIEIERPLKAGWSSGNFELYPEFHFQREVAPTKVNGLKQVILRVSWSNQGQEEELEIITYIIGDEE
jgi:general secretion pathway protein I